MLSRCHYEIGFRRHYFRHVEFRRQLAISHSAIFFAIS
jgi:hypothetical protein